eukprot:CAMPEP_0184707646 /NCGR_PEP_ID=MMETSP0313-20130426/37357_1 /TAXON_ID=2792 /ORGANISM="Porphyridium aerugineum, Strain SAG 1380-2" /LENGTH=384 /DNA_ID=CAMNT_0027169227 /DNA_START=746 /DNA_END=1900 /DNA_ORIENTATION=-
MDQALFSTTMRTDVYSILHRLNSNYEACGWLMNQQHNTTDPGLDSNIVLDAWGSDNGKLASLLASLEDEYGSDIESYEQQRQLHHASSSSCLAWILSSTSRNKSRPKTIPLTAHLDTNNLYLYWCVPWSSRYWLLFHRQYSSTPQNALIHLYSSSCILDRQVPNPPPNSLFVPENIAVYSLRQKSPISALVNRDALLDGKTYSLAYWALQCMRMSSGHPQRQYQDYQAQMIPMQYAQQLLGPMGQPTETKDVLPVSGANPASLSDRSTSHSHDSGDDDDGENPKAISSGDATNSGHDTESKALVSPDPIQQYLEEVKAMDRAGRCSCKLCGADFCRKYELKRHVRTKHLVERRTFACNVCSRKFKRKDHMTAHFKRVHMDADDG